jgi:Protein of unknown function (DUF3379)
VNCADARRFIGAEPYVTSHELAEHLQSCPACVEFQLEMVALEANIRRALAEPAIAAPIVARRRAAMRSGWALAASVVLAAVATLAVWALRPSNSLANEVVAHVIAEPQSWASNDPVAPAALDAVLRKSGVILEGTPYRVVYASSCWFRGHYVPHLVVRTAHSLVTVLILRNQTVAARQSFREDGLAGVILPAAQGSIAVLGAEKGSAQLDAVAEQMRVAVRGSSATP